MNVSLDFTVDDIEEIGRGVDPFLGRVTRYSYSTTTTKIGDDEATLDASLGVNFYFDKSIELIVYQAIDEGKEIPAENTKAIEVKKVCEDFLANNITSSMTDYEKELVIHDYLVNTCEYSFSDNNDFTEYSAYGTLINKKAVIDTFIQKQLFLLIHLAKLGRFSLL